MTKILSILALFALVGCAREPDAPIDPVKQSQRGLLRHQYFVECMKLLPAAPQSTKNNDWDEVVDACSQQAYYQANQVIP